MLRKTKIVVTLDDLQRPKIGLAPSAKGEDNKPLISSIRELIFLSTDYIL